MTVLIFLLYHMNDSPTWLRVITACMYTACNVYSVYHMRIALAHRCVTMLATCTARCSGTLNNAATFDNERVFVSTLVCNVQVNTHTHMHQRKYTRQRTVCGLQCIARVTLGSTLIFSMYSILYIYTLMAHLIQLKYFSQLETISRKL